MRKYIMLCLLLMLTSSGAWAQGESSSIALMPFVVRSQENEQMVRKLIEDVFVRQLKQDGAKVIDPQDVAGAIGARETVQTEAQARSIGGRLRADYVLFGSFNQIGNSISLDAKLVDVSGRKKTADLFAEEKGMENLASVVNSITQQMGVHLLSKGVIAEVRVKGNQRIEAEAIKSNAKSKKGELLRPELVSEDIKSIYKMGFFDKVEAEVSDSPAGKILTFVVQENPTIQELRVTGNKKIKDKDILAAISTKPYSVLQRSTINDDVQKILKLYQQKGYPNAQVKANIEFPKDPRKASVVFVIDESKKVHIKNISFRGNKSFSNRKLRGVMQSKERSFLLSWVTDRGILQRDILEADVDRLTVFYHDRGFMDAKVGTPEVNLRDDGFYIEIPIDEGQRYKVTDVKLAGDPLEGKKNIGKELVLKPSEYFSREELREDIDHISRIYMDEGYAYTEVNPEVKRDSSDRTTDVTYNVRRGDKVRIGRIFITGNTKTRDNVIRREIKLAEGDLFSSTKLERSLQALKKLDYFEEVEIVPSEGPQRDVMNLHVKVKEKLTGTISVGGGFSSDEGLFASGEVTQRNLFGRGLYVAVKAHLGEEATRYLFSFTEPWLFDRHVSAGLDAYDWEREYVDFTKHSTGFRLRSGYGFGNYSRLTASYNFESVDVKDIDADVEDFYETPLLRSLLESHVKGSVTLGFERDTTDHPFLPTKGSVNTVTVETAGQYLGSDYEMVKTIAHSGVYVPLFWKFIGFLRGEGGFIAQPDQQVPIYERFFLGGINSMRGFKWGEVGPRVTEKDEHGEEEEFIIGGSSYLVLNAELLFPIVEKMGMRGVIFFDAGNAWGSVNDADDPWEHVDLSDLRYDAGLGVRWNSPLGPLRVEWGYNLDPREGEDQYQWQFSAGAFF